MNLMSKKRILFMPECVTLAHFGRSLALADALPAEQYGILFAASPKYNKFRPERPNWQFIDIASIAPEAFQKSLKHGKIPYSESILTQYIEDDLELLSYTKPDVVVGDFRLSLNIVARHLQIPFVNIGNAYWGDTDSLAFFPEAVPYTNWLPRFALRPTFFAGFGVASNVMLRNFNRLSRRYGLKKCSTVSQLYLDGDLQLFDDVPGFFPTIQSPPSNYLGYITWSPSAHIPQAWSERPTGKPTILISMGSSGDVSLLQQMMEVAATRSETFVFVTAGRAQMRSDHANVICVDYIPLGKIMSECAVYVNNGGNSGYLALQRGVPLIGYPGNMDQCLFSSNMARAGVGRFTPTHQFTKRDFNLNLDRVLYDPSYRQAAELSRANFVGFDYRSRFPEQMASFLGR